MNEPAKTILEEFERDPELTNLHTRDGAGPSDVGA